MTLATTVGASATPVTPTWNDAVVVVVAPPLASVEVAVTVRSKSTLESSFGLIVRPLSCSCVKVQVPSPLLVPADRVAPSGTPAILIDSASEPSRSVSAALMFSAIAVSSRPCTAPTSRVGADAVLSAITAGSTLSAMVPVVSAVDVPSFEVAVTVSEKSPLESAAGVIVKPDSWLRSSPDSVQVPSPLSVPADRTAPVGTLPMVMLRVSESSVNAAAMLSAIAAPATPATAPVDWLPSEPGSRSSVGASATPATETVMVPVVSAVSAPSCDVAVTARSISPLKSAGGVRVRPLSWSPVRV